MLKSRRHQAPWGQGLCLRFSEGPHTGLSPQEGLNVCDMNAFRPMFTWIRSHLGTKRSGPLPSQTRQPDAWSGIWCQLQGTLILHFPLSIYHFKHSLVLSSKHTWCFIGPSPSVHPLTPHTQVRAHLEGQSAKMWQHYPFRKERFPSPDLC